VILMFLPVLLFVSVSTSARQICARLAAYDRSSLYDVFVLRSVDTLLVSVWGLHTMTSLSWLAIRAAIVSLQSSAPQLDAETLHQTSNY